MFWRLLAIANIFLLFTGRIAYGCQCADSTLVERVAAAEKVFAGRLIKVEVDPENFEDFHGVFKPLRMFKGNNSDLIHVRWSLSSCSFPASVGAIYLIFQNSAGQTDGCAGSKLLDYVIHFETDKSILEIEQLHLPSK